MQVKAGFQIKCGRCGRFFSTPECQKLDHYSIYRATCPHCRWPGRYLASELHRLRTVEAENPICPAAPASNLNKPPGPAAKIIAACE